MIKTPSYKINLVDPKPKLKVYATRNKPDFQSKKPWTSTQTLQKKSKPILTIESKKKSASRAPDM